MGLQPTGLVSLQAEIRTQVCIEGRPHEDAGGDDPYRPSR